MIKAFLVSDRMLSQIEEEGIAIGYFATYGESDRVCVEQASGLYRVRSFFYILNGAVGYFVADYNDDQGYMDGHFVKLQKAEAKRGPLPKNQIIVNGERFYRPII